MQETQKDQNPTTTRPDPVPAELTETFGILHKQYAPFADSVVLKDRGSRVATLDVTAATRNLIAEAERYPDITAVLPRFGFPASERSRISGAATVLEVAYHRSEGTTVDVTAICAKVADLVKDAKLCRTELTTISENALPTVLAESVRRASVPTGGRPVEVAKGLSGIVTAIRNLPATWDGADGSKVDIKARLSAFGLEEATLRRAGETADALQKAATERDKTRIEAQGQTSAPWDIYDGILWEAGKAFARAAKTAAQVAGHAELSFSLGDTVRRITQGRKLKVKTEALAEGGSATPGTGAPPAVTPPR